jgi:iron complex outermembrane receptor protein
MILAAALCLSAVEVAVAQDVQASSRKMTHIPAQPLVAALNALAGERDLQVVYRTELIGGMQTRGATGTLTADEALSKLLAGTGLTFRYLDQDTVTIVPLAATGSEPTDTLTREPSITTSQSVSDAGTGKIRMTQAVAVESEPVTQNELESLQLEEIVVTATKRSENLQDVPASIAVISGELLEKNHIDSVLELQRSVPGMTVTGGGAYASTVTIRGIGTLTNGFTVQPSVGFVIDGVTLGQANAGLFDYSDVARIEVLRGPQGTLFGKNTSAGALNIVTHNPTPQFSAKFGTSYGTNNEVRADGAISGPLGTDALLGRLAFFYNDYDGYIHDRFDGRDLNGKKQWGLRSKFLLTPRDSTRLTFIADYVDESSTCCVSPVRFLGPGSNLAELGLHPGFAGFPAGFVSEDNDEIYGVGPQSHAATARGASIQWDESLGDFALTSISAYREWAYDLEQTLNANTTPIPLGHRGINTSDQYQVSQELRIASPRYRRFDYVAGVYGYYDSHKDFNNFIIDLAPILGIPPNLATTEPKWNVRTSTLNYAAFGETNIHLNDRLTMVLGARQTHETVDFNLAGVYAFGAPMGADESVTVSNFSWRAGGRWELAPGQMAYATLSRGFKGPAYNGNSTVLGNGQQVDPEIATSYELGLKSVLLNHRIRTNLAVFLTNLEQFQAQGAIRVAGFQLPQQFLLNAGNLRSKGVELELEAVPVEGLSLNLNAAYIDASFTRFDLAPCYTGQSVAQGCVDTVQNLTGTVAPNTPKLSFNTNASYDFILTSLPFNFFVRADYAWRDEVQWNVFQDPLTVEPSYGQLGGSFGIEGKDDKYSLTLYGRNLTDEFHTAGINDSSVIGHWLLPDYRRTVGIRLDYRF